VKVTLFGSGYVGLVTGACFAERGNDVLCVDVDEEKVEALTAGKVSIFEPDLENMVQRNLESGRLTFTCDAKLGVDHGEVIFIAVGTPPEEDGSADLQHVLGVASTIGEFMSEPKVIVDKSTVPVGTADRVREAISESLSIRGADIPFDVVSNPEFLKEGAAVADFMKPDRIIVGSDNPDSTRKLSALYAPFNRNHDKVIDMDVRSAELTKYAANVMLATKISLMNEMANVAEQVGADIESVRIGIGSDPRIGYSFIYPGTGYGGSCFPKDIKALIHTANGGGYQASLVESVEAVNQRQKRVLFDKLMNHYRGDIKGRTFALWGLAFKPNTNDMREAPSRTIMELLFAEGALVRAYDPVALEEAGQLYGDQPGLELCTARDDTLDGADGLIVVTEWNEFMSPDFGRIRERMNSPVLFDGRNLYEPGYMRELGFTHYAIGRGDRAPG
jgi:UDPglucose 6-dehydrogenase